MVLMSVPRIRKGEGKVVCCFGFVWFGVVVFFGLFFKTATTKTLDTLSHLSRFLVCWLVLWNRAALK